MGRDGSRRCRSVSPDHHYAQRGVRELFAGGATLEAGALQHLLVLFLAHALAALLNK